MKIKLAQSLGNFSLSVDLSLPMSGITAIFGRSGSGKTTLVNLISGLSQPDTGRFTLGDSILLDTENGINRPPEKRNIGYVFQDARLFPHYHVEGNLLYGARNHNPGQYQEVIELLDIGHLLRRYPAGLSGGEKQRVAIGRALLSSPQLLLMDEPLASLDLPRKKELMPLLERLAKEVKIPILYVSHSLNEILRLADHMVLLDQGKVKVAGPLETVWGSEAMRPWVSAQGQSSLIQGKLVAHHEKYAMSGIDLGKRQILWVSRLDLAVGVNVRVRIGAKDVSIVKQRPVETSIRNIVPATVMNTTQSQNKVWVDLNLGKSRIGAEITLWAADDLSLKVGDSVFAQIKGVSVTRDDWAVH